MKMTHQPTGSQEFPSLKRAKDYVPRQLSFALILNTAGRIYALDLGKDHHNPDCNHVGEKHKYRWTETQRDKTA